MKSFFTSMYRNLIVFMKNAVQVDELAKYLYAKKTMLEPIAIISTLISDMQNELIPEISKIWNTEAFRMLNKESKLKYFEGCFPSILSKEFQILFLNTYRCCISHYVYEY